MPARRPHGTSSLKLIEPDENAPRPLTGAEVYKQVAELIAEHLPSIPFDDPHYVTLRILGSIRW